MWLWFISVFDMNLLNHRSRPQRFNENHRNRDQVMTKTRGYWDRDKTKTLRSWAKNKAGWDQIETKNKAGRGWDKTKNKAGKEQDKMKNKAGWDRVKIKTRPLYDTHEEMWNMQTIGISPIDLEDPQFDKNTHMQPNAKRNQLNHLYSTLIIGWICSRKF